MSFFNKIIIITSKSKYKEKRSRRESYKAHHCLNLYLLKGGTQLFEKLLKEFSTSNANQGNG
jgi:hypothetical protein